MRAKDSGAHAALSKFQNPFARSSGSMGEKNLGVP